MLKQLLCKLGNSVRHRLPAKCVSDQRGVAAVEFALIVPILLLMFIGTMEISLLVAVDRKVSRISSSVGDIIAQGAVYTKSQLDAIADIAQRIKEPYDDKIDISIVGIEIKNNKAKVAWSHAIGAGAKPTKGSAFAVPDSIKKNNTFLLSTTVSTKHEPAVSFLGFDGGSLKFDRAAIKLEEQMFLRPRKTTGITCSDC